MLQVCESACILRASRYLCFRVRLGCRRYGKLRSFFSKRDCSQHIPSQGTAHENREQLCLVRDPGRCGRIWCEFLTVRATPSRATCCWPRPLLADAAASTVRLELAPTGGISSRHTATPIEQPGRSLAPLLSPLVCLIRRPLRSADNTSDLGGG